MTTMGIPNTPWASPVREVKTKNYVIQYGSLTSRRYLIYPNEYGLMVIFPGAWEQDGQDTFIVRIRPHNVLIPKWLPTWFMWWRIDFIIYKNEVSEVRWRRSRRRYMKKAGKVLAKRKKEEGYKR